MFDLIARFLKKKERDNKKSSFKQSSDKKSVSKRLRVLGKKDVNKVIGKPRIHRAGKVTFQGEGNTVIFGKGVLLKYVHIRFIGNNSTVHIGDNVSLNGDFFLKNNCSINVGSGSKFNNQTSKLFCGEHNTKISVGENCLIADAKIRTSDQHAIIDNKTGKRTNYPEDVVIEDGVWIAEDVRIYRGAFIGEGTVVGARATVFGTLPANSLCVGTPARAVKANISWVDKV